VTFGLLGLGQFIDLFLIPSMVDNKNLINRALSEDIKNDAIRQATLVIAGVHAAQNAKKESDMASEVNAELIIVEVLSQATNLTFGRICAASGLRSEVVKQELDKLLMLDAVRVSNRTEDGVMVYTLQ